VPEVGSHDVVGVVAPCHEFRPVVLREVTRERRSVERRVALRPLCLRPEEPAQDQRIAAPEVEGERAVARAAVGPIRAGSDPDLADRAARLRGRPERVLRVGPGAGPVLTRAPGAAGVHVEHGLALVGHSVPIVVAGRAGDDVHGVVVTVRVAVGKAVVSVARDRARMCADHVRVRGARVDPWVHAGRCTLVQEFRVAEAQKLLVTPRGERHHRAVGRATGHESVSEGEGELALPGVDTSADHRGQVMVAAQVVAELVRQCRHTRGRAVDRETRLGPVGEPCGAALAWHVHVERHEVGPSLVAQRVHVVEVAVVGLGEPHEVIEERHTRFVVGDGDDADDTHARAGLAGEESLVRGAGSELHEGRERHTRAVRLVRRCCGVQYEQVDHAAVVAAWRSDRYGRHRGADGVRHSQRRGRHGAPWRRLRARAGRRGAWKRRGRQRPHLDTRGRLARDEVAETVPTHPDRALALLPDHDEVAVGRREETPRRRPSRRAHFMPVDDTDRGAATWGGECDRRPEPQIGWRG
jgi:hypothetical protein